jgi:sulfide:quinone oxidoreductase
MLAIQKLAEGTSVTGNVLTTDIPKIAGLGFRALINNRPDGEAADQATNAALEQAAHTAGLQYRHIPITPSGRSDSDTAAFADAMQALPRPILAFCRSGTRSTGAWTAARQLIDEKHAGTTSAFDVVVVGGGAAGSAVAASRRKQRPGLSVAVVEPSDTHFYQPGWTMVGGGVFTQAQTHRPMKSAIPGWATWIKYSVTAFAPTQNQVTLANNECLSCRALVVATGLRTKWEAIEGLEETLGRNGVTSNYRFDLAPYTWERVQGLRSGKALFTQPPMPIKCAGTPQKALYLSCDHWLRNGVLDKIAVEFNTAAPVLFGVADFVPPLINYIRRYNAGLHVTSTLKAVDGPARIATFEIKNADGTTRIEQKSFDILHVVPPQVAPDVVAKSELADAAGWVEVSSSTLQHPRFPNVFSLGDVCSAPNAKTAAAVRKQAPIVATNLLSVLDGQAMTQVYDGYGACPLTVERGRVVLAEFGYGGKLLPTFPLDPTKARRLAWLLKVMVMPKVYWNLMLRGREWLTQCPKTAA